MFPSNLTQRILMNSRTQQNIEIYAIIYTATLPDEQSAKRELIENLYRYHDLINPHTDNVIYLSRNPQ